MNHMRPEYEIIQWLRPIERNEERPNQVPNSKKNSDGERSLCWTKMLHCVSLGSGAYEINVAPGGYLVFILPG